MFLEIVKLYFTKQTLASCVSKLHTHTIFKKHVEMLI